MGATQCHAEAPTADSGYGPRPATANYRATCYGQTRAQAHQTASHTAAAHVELMRAIAHLSPTKSTPK